MNVRIKPSLELVWATALSVIMMGMAIGLREDTESSCSPARFTLIIDSKSTRC